MRSFSIAEIIDCGMPVSSASLFWLSSCSSRMMRTDSPTDLLYRQGCDASRTPDFNVVAGRREYDVLYYLPIAYHCICACGTTCADTECARRPFLHPVKPLLIRVPSTNLLFSSLPFLRAWHQFCKIYQRPDVDLTPLTIDKVRNNGEGHQQ